MAARKTDRELAERHRYRLLDGRLAVSVTSISGLLDDGKAMGFAYAATKLAKEGLDFRQEWNAKGDRGTRIHGHLESWLRGETIEQADDEKGYVDALEKWIIADDPEVIEQEAIVLSDLGFGGRFDLLCRIRGETALIDLKAGKSYPVEHSLQIAGYAHADGIAVFGEDENLSHLRPLPPIDWGGCLYVHEDGTYDLDRYPIGEETFAVFCNLLAAYQWMRSDEMKALGKEAKARSSRAKEVEL